MIKKAILKAFDATNYTATVQLEGSLSLWLTNVKVSRGIPSGEMVVGRGVAVLFLTNPEDALIVGVF